VIVPDSAVAVSAAAMSGDEAVRHRCHRVFLFGSLVGRARGLVADPELLYVGAMLHDVGSRRASATRGDRPEVVSADTARTLLLDEGHDPSDARLVWLAIALHTTPGIAEHLEPEVALLRAGFQATEFGLGLGEIEPEHVAAVRRAHSMLPSARHRPTGDQEHSHAGRRH
jgi:hypothetical protein